MSRLFRILIYLIPGLAMAIAAILWGRFLQPPRNHVDAWQGQWSEPKMPPGLYKSWRVEGDHIVGETEPWPHKHPRASSFLLSEAAYEGDVAVRVNAAFRNEKFPDGRYLGCYLCYDPKVGNGYWLATGHAVGEDPNRAYIKVMHNHEWKFVADAPLEIVPHREYDFVFRRKGDELAIVVDGKVIVSTTDSEFHTGHVQLQLHNTEIELRHLSVDGQAQKSE